MKKYLPIILAIGVLSRVLYSQDKPIVFTYPSRSNTNSEEILVKGVVTSDNIDNVEISATNLWDLIETPEKDSGKEIKSVYEKLEYKKAPIKGMGFSTKLKLKEGMNAVIALPEGVEKVKENITLKVIIYDIKDKNIEIVQPKSERIKDLSEISGVIKDSEVSIISITIKAMRKKLLKKESIYRVEKILETEVKLDKGKFSLPVELPEDISDKGALIIDIKAGNYHATKTLY